MPLIHNGVAIGALSINRDAVRPYSAREIALVESFADQAAIAVANARLFEDLQQSNRQTTEALEQQTALAEVLRVIAASPTDLQAVLDAVAERAVRVCDADDAQIFQVIGDAVYLVAHDGPLETPAYFRDGRPLDRTFVAGRTAVDRVTIHIEDYGAVFTTEFPEYYQSNLLAGRGIPGHWSLLSVPLLREGVALGSITVRRVEVRPFTERQIALLQTFADQAVIAIENARLFEELERRTSDLERALEQQTALGDVLRVIATSTTDLPAVLQRVVETAARLCHADNVGVMRVDGDALVRVVNLAGAAGPLPLGSRIPLTPGVLSGRAVLEKRPFVIDDVWAVMDQQFPDSAQVARQLPDGAGTRLSTRSFLAVPLIVEDTAIGALISERAEVRPFSEGEISLMQTFADQAVIAIENARLFEELQDANRQLAEASGHKSQFLANMSHELRTPLNAIIGYSEMLQEEAEDLDADAFLPDLQRINSAGKHLLGLINDILDLSKIEAGRMDLFLETFEIDQMVKDVAAIVQPLVEKNGNTLIVDLPGRPRRACTPTRRRSARRCSTCSRTPPSSPSTDVSSCASRGRRPSPSPSPPWSTPRPSSRSRCQTPGSG